MPVNALLGLFAWIFGLFADYVDEINEEEERRRGKD